MDLVGKKVCVLGLARSGAAAANLLHTCGASVCVSDIKPVEKLAEYIALLESPEIQVSANADQIKDVSDSDLVVLSPGIPDTVPPVKAAREKGIPVISEIELAYQNSPAPMVAITGSNGKTTTTTWTYEMFKSAWKKGPVAVAGNIGYPLSAAIRNMTSQGVVIAEISSFQLETITSFRPKIAAILNISRNHLDWYPGMDEYARAKFRIFDYQTAEDIALLNLDNYELMNRLPDIASRKMFFSTTQSVDYGVMLAGNRIIYRDGSHEVNVCDKCDLGLPGCHNLENAMAGIAIACTMGIPAIDIVPTLKTFRGVEHRLEFVKELKGVKYYNDSKATTVASVMTALSALPAPIVLIMGGKDKGSDYQPLIPLIKEKVKTLILMGQAKDIIYDALGKSVFTVKCATMEESVAVASQNAIDGDAVVLSPACSSYDMYSDYEERGRVFKEIIEGL